MHVSRKTGTKPRYQRKLLCAAISLSLLPLTGTALAQDDAVVEEVIVTRLLYQTNRRISVSVTTDANKPGRYCC